MKLLAFLPALLLLLLPTYTWRFSLFGWPANFLLVAELAIVLLFLATFLFSAQARKAATEAIVKTPRPLTCSVFLLVLAGLVSWQQAAFTTGALGQLLVLVLLPVAIFGICRVVAGKTPQAEKYFVDTALLQLAVFGLLAILQYFTLYGLPEGYWGNSQEPKRALAVFTHPNFYGLLAAPLLAFVWPFVVSAFSGSKKRLYVYMFTWCAGAVGVFLSLSRGAWLGLLAAGVVWLVFLAQGKVRRVAIATGLLIVLLVAIVPNWRYRVLLPFYGEQSASQRTLLWQKASDNIKDNPMFGWGWNGFANSDADVQVRREFWCSDPSVSCIPEQRPDFSFLKQQHPHNFWLMAWGELGLVGLISFALIFLFSFRVTVQKRRQSLAHAGALLALVAVFAHGIIDTPYFKNDLASLFWILLVWL